jgi:hypothetical protein
MKIFRIVFDTAALDLKKGIVEMMVMWVLLLN